MINPITKIQTFFSSIKNKAATRKISQQRKVAETVINSLDFGFSPTIEGSVLVDATYDNPNYWLRYCLLRAALGFKGLGQTAFIGPFRRNEQQLTLKRLGIELGFDLMRMKGHDEKNSSLAKELCRSAASQRDILSWKLPKGVPADYLYDHLLKRQRRAEVDLEAQSFIDHTRDFLNFIDATWTIIETSNPGLVVSSHAIGYNMPLVWAALQKNIPVVVPVGFYGLLTFWRLQKLADRYEFMDRPRPEEIELLSPGQRESLTLLGERILDQRLSGRAANIGTLYAYKMRPDMVSRDEICAGFGWDPAKPVTAVYAPNWFDYPHSFGMKFFDNFLDWIKAVLAEAAKNKSVNWIFKAHPCDDWYGGITLADLIDVSAFDHIRLAPKTWNNSAMIKAIDSFITYQGTIGLEAAGCGKPVMAAEPGWYHDWGFVTLPSSKEDFLSLLGRPWWEERNPEEDARLAKLFMGWYLGKPSWQKNFAYGDDTAQWSLYKDTPSFINGNFETIKREIETIRSWWLSGHSHLHTFSMIQAEDYTL